MKPRRFSRVEECARELFGVPRGAQSGLGPPRTESGTTRGSSGRQDLEPGRRGQRQELSAVCPQWQCTNQDHGRPLCRAKRGRPPKGRRVGDFGGRFDDACACQPRAGKRRGPAVCTPITCVNSVTYDSTRLMRRSARGRTARRRPGRSRGGRRGAPGGRRRSANRSPPCGRARALACAFARRA